MHVDIHFQISYEHSAKKGFQTPSEMIQTLHITKVATQLEFDLCPQNSFRNVPQFILSCHHHNHAVLPLCQATFESLQ